jgi:hypothetical protein
MWNAGFTCGVGGTRSGVNLPGIHPVEIIAAGAEANAGPENRYLPSRVMNDRDPMFSCRPFFYQDCYVHRAVAIKISFQIERVHARGEIILFSDRPIR